MTVSLDVREAAALIAIAGRRDVSVAWIVRQAIHALIEREKSEADNSEPPLIRKAGRHWQAPP